MPNAAGRARVLGYQTEIRRGDSGTWTDRRTFLGQSITGATYANLDNGIEYQVRVRSVNAEGDCGWSMPVSGIPTGDLAPKDDIEHAERFGPHPIGTDARNFRLLTPGRCRHMTDGVNLDADCVYERTSPDTGRIFLEFDDPSRGSCELTLAYSSLTAGSFLDECFNAGVNTNVPFDRSFRMPWSAPGTEDDFGPPIETEPQRAPRNQDEFDALVYGRDDFIPGLCFGNCYHGDPPEFGVARRIVTGPNGSTSERYGHYTYESTGLSRGVLNFAENIGSTWVFTLDFEPSGNVSAKITDANGNATDWPGIAYADLLPTTPILLPIPPIWHGLEFAIDRLTPKTIGELASLLDEVNDSDNVEDTSVVNDDVVIRLLVRRYLSSLFGETLGGRLVEEIADIVDTEVTVGFRRLRDNRVIVDLKFDEGRQVNSSEIWRSVFQHLHEEKTTQAVGPLINDVIIGAIGGGLSGIPLAGYIIGKLYDLLNNNDDAESDAFLQVLWNFFLNQMSGLRITYECASTGNFAVYECGVTGDKQGEIPLVGHLPIDFAGNSIDFNEFPTDSFLPDDPPQASGEDLSGVEVAAAITTLAIGANDLQTFLVSNTGAAYSAGDWLEPKDGGNQRMMVVSAGQPASFMASNVAPEVYPSEAMAMMALVPQLTPIAASNQAPQVYPSEAMATTTSAPQFYALGGNLTAGFKARVELAPYMVSGINAAGAVEPNPALSTANETGFMQLAVVCMQKDHDIPPRGARYFSVAKAAEDPIQMCQKQCVLNKNENIQRCVWDCEQ